MSSGYALHPEAVADLDDIGDYVARENPDAADRTMEEIFETMRGLCPFLIKATDAPTSLHGLCDSLSCVNT
jgi:plasmid stabilization system protein ParE